MMNVYRLVTKVAGVVSFVGPLDLVLASLEF
jgi:hypothetical protein